MDRMGINKGDRFLLDLSSFTNRKLSGNKKVRCTVVDFFESIPSGGGNPNGGKPGALVHLDYEDDRLDVEAIPANIVNWNPEIHDKFDLGTLQPIPLDELNERISMSVAC